MEENDEECEGCDKSGRHRDWNTPERLKVFLQTKDRQTVEACETNRPAQQVDEGNRPTDARLRCLKSFRQLQIQKNSLRAEQRWSHPEGNKICQRIEFTSEV